MATGAVKKPAGTGPPANLLPSQAEWSSFASVLPHSGGMQDAKSRLMAENDTFVPAMQRNFSLSVLSQFTTSPPAQDAATIMAALKEFGRTVSAAARDVETIEGVLSKAKNYTSVLAALVHIYTLEGFFFRSMNQALREDNAQQLVKLSPIISCLSEGLTIFPFVGTVWRGFSLTGVEAAAYQKGLVFLWPAFTSCSKSKDVAKDFSRGNGRGAAVLFKIEITSAQCCAGDIQSVSYFEDESEVLMAPYTSLTVHKTSAEDGVTVVDCSALSSLRNLTGIWTCAEDQGTYYISQIASNVLWLAVGPGFAHVFFGSINDRELTGTFSDLPCDDWRYSGTIALSVDEVFSGMSLDREKSPDFLGQTFRKKKAHVDEEEVPKLNHCGVAGDRGLTGEWKSDKELSYFVREVGGDENKELFWFAYAPKDWSAANVFWGTWNGNEYIGIYSDLILSTRFRYAGRIAVQPHGATMQIRVIEGAYMCNILTKTSATDTDVSSLSLEDN